jgi:hypothetical protein
MTVYFIKPVDMDGPVKIGHSKSPPDRLRAVEFWSPLPLEIVALIDGGEEIERRFHALFLDDHSHREWFHPTPRLAQVIAEINAGTFDVRSLPSSEGSYGVGLRRKRTEAERRSHSEKMKQSWAERKAIPEGFLFPVEQAA